MKNTYIDNPEILVKDPRLLELDQVVNEVKESEEWEAVKMNILELGIEHGKKQGVHEKYIELIQMKLTKGHTVKEIADMLEENVEVIESIAKELDLNK